MTEDRRSFIRLAAAGTIGAAIYPVDALAQPLPVLSWIAALAENVAYGIIGNTIYDVIKGYLTDKAREFGLSSVGRAHDSGFKVGERVYGPSRSIAGYPYFVFPMVRTDEPIEGAMKFLSFCSCGYSTGLLSGPSLVALSQAASDMSTVSGISRSALHRLLMPKVQDSAALGRFCEPYSMPDMYRTESGAAVRVDYTHEENENHGHARFAYYEPRNFYTPAFQREYRLPLPV